MHCGSQLDAVVIGHFCMVCCRPKTCTLWPVLVLDLLLLKLNILPCIRHPKGTGNVGHPCGPCCRKLPWGEIISQGPCPMRGASFHKQAWFSIAHEHCTGLQCHNFGCICLPELKNGIVQDVSLGVYNTVHSSCVATLRSLVCLDLPSQG